MSFGYFIYTYVVWERSSDCKLRKQTNTNTTVVHLYFLKLQCIDLPHHHHKKNKKTKKEKTPPQLLRLIMSKYNV